MRPSEYREQRFWVCRTTTATGRSTVTYWESTRQFAIEAGSEAKIAGGSFLRWSGRRALLISTSLSIRQLNRASARGLLSSMNRRNGPNRPKSKACCPQNTAKCLGAPKSIATFEQIPPGCSKLSLGMRNCPPLFSNKVVAQGAGPACVWSINQPPIQIPPKHLIDAANKSSKPTIASTVSVKVACR